ncbi:MAG: hypothetical protein ACE37D_01190 [Pseudomonadales bacterium]
MKRTILFISLFLASAAQADSRWWQEGGLHFERYQHQLDHRDKHKRHHKQYRKDKHQQYRKHYRQDTKKQVHQHRRDHRNDYKPRRWEKVSAFRGRSGKDVTRYINVNDRVQALSIQGTKRAMYIRKAHALMGNGRWVRVRGLEGYVGHGERIKHRLRKDRFVNQVVLEVEPARYKRGYAELLVRPS